MMRIIAGDLKGRQFESPHAQRTHPMADKVRGALFNALGDIEGLTVLDAFAGSGALGYEAVSRGAAHVMAIDIDKRAQHAIAANIKALGIGSKMKLIKANASGWSDNNPDASFDIVIAAPPYDDLQPKLMAKLIRHAKPEGLFILDWPGKMELPDLPGLELLTAKNHGDAQIAFYRA
ncbi:MAG TPA: RsmD family RNA methyltransferase [Candidatus Saccharimonadales bacterium]|nr:RsmD family RNA methyltransferase [Candidatus Saccharimonadales bacterium]